MKYFSRPPIVLDWDDLILAQDGSTQGFEIEDVEPDTERCPPNPALLARCKRPPEIQKTDFKKFAKSS